LNLFQAATLGFVQGATEFLPISSSGHLVIVGELLGVTPEGNLAFGVFLHFATALAVMVYFGRRFINLLRVLVANPWRAVTGRDIPAGDKRLGKLLVGIIIGTLPAVAVGLLWKSDIERAFQSPELAGWMLLVTAVILFSLRLRRRRKTDNAPKDDTAPAPNWWRSLAIGGAQALSILPGISRSGSTIAAGLHLNIEQRRAAEFSFLLSLPAILGANLLELGGVLQSADWLSWPAYLIGGLAAFLTALGAIRVVMGTVQSGRFWLFGFYCLAAGVMTIVLA
jgi:undecaprenyl-diphosphatase